MTSSVLYPATRPCSTNFWMGLNGKHGANPPASISAAKEACTCVSNRGPPPPVENGLLICLPSPTDVVGLLIVMSTRLREPARRPHLQIGAPGHRELVRFAAKPAPTHL